MANSEQWRPCSQEQGFCPSMEQRIKFPGDRGYGFFALIKRFDLEKKQAQEKIKGVMYKSDAKDRGLMMTFCPFCGSKIDWFRESGKVPENKPEKTAHEIQA